MNALIHVCARGVLKNPMGPGTPQGTHVNINHKKAQKMRRIRNKPGEHGESTWPRARISKRATAARREYIINILKTMTLSRNWRRRERRTASPRASRATHSHGACRRKKIHIIRQWKENNAELSRPTPNRMTSTVKYSNISKSSENVWEKTEIQKPKEKEFTVDSGMSAWLHSKYSPVCCPRSAPP
jgi:hypothetical protein